MRDKPKLTALKFAKTKSVKTIGSNKNMSSSKKGKKRKEKKHNSGSHRTQHKKINKDTSSKSMGKSQSLPGKLASLQNTSRQRARSPPWEEIPQLQWYC